MNSKRSPFVPVLFQIGDAHRYYEQIPLTSKGTDYFLRLFHWNNIIEGESRILCVSEVQNMYFCYILILNVSNT